MYYSVNDTGILGKKKSEMMDKTMSAARLRS